MQWQVESLLDGQPRNSVTRSRCRRTVASGRGIASVTSVAPASRADSTPLPKPPTQKNGIGRYSRVSASMQRAARPDRTAASALPCEWITPFGGPLLPEVNMMTSVSLGVTAAVIASITGPACGLTNRSGAQTCCNAGSSGVFTTSARSSR